MDSLKGQFDKLEKLSIWNDWKIIKEKGLVFKRERNSEKWEKIEKNKL